MQLRYAMGTAPEYKLSTSWCEFQKLVNHLLIAHAACSVAKHAGTRTRRRMHGCIKTSIT
jgi:hypothetical protein